MDPVKEQLHVPVSGIRKKAAPFLCQGPDRFSNADLMGAFPVTSRRRAHDIKTPETALRGVCLLE